MPLLPQGGDWATRFCSPEVAFALVQIYNASASKNENLRATTASTLSRLLRHSPALIGYVLDKFGIRLLVLGLADASSKVNALTGVCDPGTMIAPAQWASWTALGLARRGELQRGPVRPATL